ncbi:recombinase family protein [Salmonella enterica]|nr:recombinase family protein [Salmonella enterica]EGL7282643.1 recombinase family protein [Salmonella enterica]EGM5504352.1 recombinase family protein [Salmonella enterica]EGM5523129.1 recombinase family protein [Salmonella enterica]EHK6449961.1 recombinase family protein [Salmonella enterica]
MWVSTNDQNTDLQRNALVCAECEQVFEDKISGTKVIRPGLKQALKRFNNPVASLSLCSSP